MKSPAYWRSVAAVLMALGLMSTAVCAAESEIDPVAATIDLYARMSARDLPGLLRYVPAAGLTEIAPGAPGPRTLEPSAFEALFNSDLSIALHAEDVRIQRYGDAAVVTGLRVGTVGPKAASSPDERDPFTMVWTRDVFGWRLRHVHVSAAQHEPARPATRD